MKGEGMSQGVIENPAEHRFELALDGDDIAAACGQLAGQVQARGRRLIRVARLAS